MKKYVSIVLTLVLVLGIAIPASASQITIGTIETEDQKLARVQAEVLSGNITNEQDVIEVALAQYAEKVSYYRANGLELDPNESLSITQVVESDARVASNETIEQIAITGLLITDENGNQLSAADIVSVTDSDNISVENDSVKAYTTMLVLIDTTTRRAKTSYISTTLKYYNGFTAETLQNEFVNHTAVHYGEPLHDRQLDTLIRSPFQGAPYTFYPSNSYQNAEDTTRVYFGYGRIEVAGTEYRTYLRYYPFTYFD